ncbi:hypothetical protein GCM10025793_19050 [Lysobacter lycopersici]
MLAVAVIAGVTLYRRFHSTAVVAEAVHGNAAESGRAGPVRPMSLEELRARATKPLGQSGSGTVKDMAEMMEKRKRMAAESQERIQKNNAAMATGFASEKVDPAWSGVHEKSLASLQDSGPMHDAGAKVENFQAECRSSMCRIQGDFPDAGMASDWLQLYMSSVGDRLPVATAHQIRNPDGSVRIEIYGVGRKR